MKEDEECDYDHTLKIVVLEKTIQTWGLACVGIKKEPTISGLMIL